MTDTAAFETMLAAIRSDIAVPLLAPSSRKIAFRPARDEREGTGNQGRVKSVRKYLSRQSRLNARRALKHEAAVGEFDVMPVKGDVHCAEVLAGSMRHSRTVIESLTPKEAARLIRLGRPARRRKHESETAFAARLAAAATHLQSTAATTL